jgi:hypothetical protein
MSLQPGYKNEAKDKITYEERQKCGKARQGFSEGTGNSGRSQKRNRPFFLEITVS